MKMMMVISNIINGRVPAKVIDKFHRARTALDVERWNGNAADDAAMCKWNRERVVRDKEELERHEKILNKIINNEAARGAPQCRGRVPC